jgi:hypothetical protein
VKGDVFHTRIDNPPEDLPVCLNSLPGRSPVATFSLVSYNLGSRSTVTDAKTDRKESREKRTTQAADRVLVLGMRIVLLRTPREQDSARASEPSLGTARICL